MTAAEKAAYDAGARQAVRDYRANRVQPWSAVRIGEAELYGTPADVAWWTGYHDVIWHTEHGTIPTGEDQP